MPSVQPYQAWFFFGADDTTEVNVEYEKAVDALDDDGSYYIPDLTDRVTVVAVEYDHQSRAPGEFVWFLREGRIERRDSWMVRRIVP